MFLLTDVGASETVTAVVVCALVFGWTFAAARFASVPVEVLASPAGLCVRARRRWRPYRELDIAVRWTDVREAIVTHQQESGATAWLLVHLREPPMAFSLGGEVEALRSLEQSMRNFLLEPDDQARRHLAEIVTGAGFWKSRAAAFLTILLGVMWAVLTGAGVMDRFGRPETGNPFPWLVWLVLTLLCAIWLHVYRSARKRG